MAIVKTKKADLMSKYRKVLELSLIVSLAVLIVAFKFFPDLKGKVINSEPPQDVIKWEDIQHTKQENRPPPPPRPPIPIEAPTSDVLEVFEIGETDIDLNQQMNMPPPPPKKAIEVEEDRYFAAVDEMPEPIGGIAGIREKIIYPEIAKRAGVEGKVYVLAFVDESGTVTDTKIMKGIGAGCDEAALDAVKKTKFKPGKQRDKAVKVRITIPVVFQLQ